jgi:phosphate transport system substrate-binding protein
LKKSVLAVLLTLALAITLAVSTVSPGLAAPPPDKTLINGAGATFPYPIYSKWFDQYNKLHPDIQINYQSVGSGAGIKQLLSGTVDFGASDGPMTDDQIAQAKITVLHFPTVLGADVPSYNIPGVNAELNFTQAALAGIYLGTIKKWNDPEIASANKGVNLPDHELYVVHRSDGSGTTYIWTDYLSKISDDWKNKVGKGTSVNWPVGLGGKGNEGVAGLIKQTPYSIGYVELIYAIQNNQPYGLVRNSSGVFVKASLAGVSAAAVGADFNSHPDFRVSITNAPGKSAYPISSFTWLLIPSKIADGAKRQALTGFLRWMLSDGQQYCEGLAYAKLPKEVVAREMKALPQIQ